MCPQSTQYLDVLKIPKKELNSRNNNTFKVHGKQRFAVSKKLMLMSLCLKNLLLLGGYYTNPHYTDEGKCSAERVRTQVLRTSQWQTGGSIPSLLPRHSVVFSVFYHASLPNRTLTGHMKLQEVCYTHIQPDSSEFLSVWFDWFNPSFFAASCCFSMGPLCKLNALPQSLSGL